MSQEKRNNFGIIDLINQMFRKKLFMMLVKDGKADFILGYFQDRYIGTTAVGGRDYI